jgi:hypothetical protein
MIIAAAAFLIVTAAAVRPSVANEPTNNNYSWANGVNSQWNGNMTVMSAYALWVTWPGVESITTSTDVDYLLMTCGTAHIYGAGADFTHANGDIDIQYYSTSGAYLGSSTGVTDSEWLGLGTQYNSVVMKVYGYGGATNSYTPTISCM